MTEPRTPDEAARLAAEHRADQQAQIVEAATNAPTPAGEMLPPDHPVQVGAPRSHWRDVWLQFRAHKGAMVALAVFVLVVLFVVAGPYLWQMDPTYADIRNRNAGFSAAHPLGTDQLGRDTLARLMAGGRITLSVGLTAMVIAAVVGIPAGIWAGYRPDRKSSKLIMALSVLGFSVPTFWIGMLLIMAFAVSLGWLPSGGRGEVGTILGIHTSLATRDGWAHVILPALNLSLFNMGLMIRLTRAGVVEAMRMDYVKFARAQGLPDGQIVRRHVLRNIMIPVITVFGLELGSTLAFAVVTETVFNWPGIGKLIIDSILQLDRPVMVAYLVLVVILFVFINLAVDLIYARLDPRIRLKGGA